MTNASLMARLKVATRPVHERIALLPFVRALDSGTLPRAAFVDFLRALHTVHVGFERELQRSRDPRVRGAWSESMACSGELRADLERLTHAECGTQAASLVAAASLTKQLRRRVLSHPISLLGFLYAFEGSRRGSPMLAAWVRRHDMDIQSHYLSRAAKGSRQRWRAFSASMNSIELQESEVCEVVVGAEAALAAMEQVVAALDPAAPAWASVSSSLLNPHAGNHPVTQDPVELEGLRKAGCGSLEECPYLTERYGERGRKFTDSDSAWLVTLAGVPERVARDEVCWLARVLAARGMPSVILEQHLYRLEAELQNGPRGAERDYRVLSAVARQFAEERQSVVSAEATRSITNRFEEAVDLALKRRLGNVASLIVSAVADEALGRPRAVSSLQSWLCDPQRFPAAWTRACDVAFDSARAQVAGAEAVGKRHRASPDGRTSPL